MAGVSMPNDDRAHVHEGYLLLADISGYTAFLTGTELETCAGHHPRADEAHTLAARASDEVREARR